MAFARLLTKLRERSDLSKADLARRIGVTLGYIVAIEAGRSKPPTIERCHQIAKALNLSEEEKAQLVQAATLERVDTEHRPFLEEYFRRAKSIKELPPEAIVPKGFDRVPVLGTAPAGEKSFAHDEVEQWVPLPREITKGRRTYLLRVAGDSMIPRINPGDFVIVDADAQPENGQTVVIRIDSESAIKRFSRYGETIVLESTNPKYPRQEYPVAKHEIQLRGVVKGALWESFLK